ncbi:organic cation transporter protein-like isoform X2 [Amphiura filiformis]|uniref:organic cation transporter protein-like isoform X2 n=1 Tax=Amphiura filiformis TaxID=82378 RepID=UPI003B20F7AC
MSSHRFFLSASSEHWCSTNDYDFDFNCTSIELDNKQCIEFIKNVTIPSSVNKKGKVVYEQCQRYNLTGIEISQSEITEMNVTQTQRCDAGWEFDRSQYKTTIVQDFNLVCDRKNLVNYANAAYFAGFLVGAFSFGNLSDRIGRYPAYFISIGLWTVVSIISAFVYNFVAYAILRFFIGATSIASLVAYIVFTEIVGPSKRPMAGNVIWLFFAVGYMLIAILAYFIREWRHLQLVISVPLVLFFLLVPVLCESPRWLISMGRYEKAEKILRKAATENKAELPEKLFDEHEHIQMQTEKAEKGTPMDLFRTPNLRCKTLNLFYNWFVNNMVYYGLSLSTSGLGVNAYLAAFVSGAVEIPAYLSCWFILDRFGRRLPISTYLFVAGVACIISTFVPPGVGRTIVAMIGKFAVTASFSVVYIFSGEIYPTPVRSIGMGMSSMCARISGIIAPFILILGNYWEQLPFVIFGVNSIIAGLLALLLPETHGMSLPETLVEGDAFDSKYRCTVLD